MKKKKKRDAGEDTQESTEDEGMMTEDENSGLPSPLPPMITPTPDIKQLQDEPESDDDIDDEHDHETEEEMAAAKSEAERMAAAAAEEAREIERQRQEQLLFVMTDLYKASVDSYHTFMRDMKQRGYVTLETPIDSDVIIRIMNKHVISAITPFLEHQYALFYTPHTISHHDAHILLSDGTKSLREYGSYCPVCLSMNHTNDCYNDKESYPITWSHYVIYTCSQEHQLECISNIKHYMGQIAPLPPIALSAVVMGPPLSNKTSLSQKLAHDMDLVYLNMALILEETSHDIHTSIGSEIHRALTLGETITDELKIRALKHILETTSCRIQGWILDGFPETEIQSHLMSKYDIIPYEIFSLKLGEDQGIFEQMKERMLRQKQHYEQERNGIINRFIRGDSVQWIPSDTSDSEMMIHTQIPLDPILQPLRNPQDELTSYDNEVIGLHTHYQRTYNNLNLLSSNESIWKCIEKMQHILLQSKMARQQHYIQTSKGQPGMVHHMGITNHALHQYRSQYQDYCPVCIIDEHALRRYITDLSYTVEYQHKYYRMCSSKHVHQFLSHPTKYAGNAPHQILPQYLPKRLSFTDCQRIESKHCVLGGNCPVTIAKAFKKGISSVVPGVITCTVKYKNNIYRLAGESELSTFMTFPTQYENIILPQKLPPHFEPVAPRDMLALGQSLAYMEQTVASIITQGMTSMDKIRVKYPHLSITASAQAYLALYLKANHPNNTEYQTKKYKEKLNAFLSVCSLIPALSSAYKTISMAEYAHANMSAENVLTTSVQTNLPIAQAFIEKSSPQYDQAWEQDDQSLIQRYTR